MRATHVLPRGKSVGKETANRKIITRPTIPRAISEIMYFMLMRPMNISTRQVTKRMAAVEKLAGRIRIVTITTGMITGRNPFLKSCTSSCFLVRTLARYMISTSFATSELWKVRLTIGTVSQRFASFRFVPEISVRASSGMVMTIPILEIHEKWVYLMRWVPYMIARPNARIMKCLNK